MAATMFSFKDAVHDHLTIGFVRGCVACAQTEADMALSRAAASGVKPVRAVQEIAEADLSEPALAASA